MRIGGAFPFSSTDPSQGGGTLALPSGGIFFPPSGNYLFTSGGQTIPQVWDPIGQQWRGFGPPPGHEVEMQMDGYNHRLINMSGVVIGANITNAGTGATNGIGTAATGVTVTIAAPTAGVTATAYPIVGGSVQAPTITQAGTGYLVPPMVVIDPPAPGGIQAKAYCTLTAVGGGLATIVMTDVGAGYVASPNFWLIPQANIYQGSPSGGVAAGLFPVPGQVTLANALPSYGPLAYPNGTLLTELPLTGSGTLTGIAMVSYGSNYTGTTIPAVTIAGAGAAAATAIGSFAVTGFTSLVGGANYTNPAWFTTLGVVSAYNSGNPLTQLGAIGVGTTSGGAVNALSIEYPGFGLQKVPLVIIASANSLETVQAAAVATIGGIVDVSLLQSKIPV